MYAYDPVAKAVEDALLAHPDLDGAAIDVSNDRGVIVLSGTVLDEEMATKTVELAAKVPGVIQVISNLRIERNPGPVDDPTFSRDPIYGEHKR